MKKNKMKLDKKQIPEQVVDLQVEEVVLTEEEEKEKKGLMAWINRHRKGVALTATGIAFFFLLIAMKEPKNIHEKEEDLPENPGYEDVKNENNTVDETIKSEVTPVDKKMCTCVSITEDCPCDDDELGCTCTELEHEENCLAKVAVVEEETTVSEEDSRQASSVKDETDTKEQKTKKEDAQEETEHKHVFGNWVSMNDLSEQRTCECGKKETRLHDYVNGKTTYDYEANGKHNETTVSKCKNCGHVKKKTVLDNCQNVILDFDEKYEYLKCDECEEESKRLHVLGIGKKNEDGSVEYKCIHEGCKYKKIEKASKDNKTKDDEKNPSGEKDPTGPSVNPTGPSVDPTGPSVDPTGPSVDPTGPSVDPTGPSVDPTGPSVDPTGPSVDPTGPSVDPTGPSVDPTGPSVDPTGPSVDPTGPSTDPTGPSGDDGDRDFTGGDGNGNQNNENAGNTGKEEGFEPDEEELEEEKNLINEGLENESDTSVDRVLDEGEIELSDVEAELQTLYAMREIVINGITLEYSVEVEPQVENSQYIIKKS